jgi:hypothetical protein
MGVLRPAARFDEWLPIRAFWRDGGGWVDWCHFGKRRLTEPFFRDSVIGALRVPFNQAFRRESPIEALAEWRAASPGLAPTAFILHASRCGSTLASQMLAALPGHIMVSEPPMLDAVLHAHGHLHGLPREVQVEWVRGMVSALGQPRNGESALVIKLDAWNVFDLDVLREAFPATPWIYLYRDPLEIAMSQLRERASYLVPGMVGPVLQLIPLAEALAMPTEEYIARVLGAILEAGHARCADSGGILVHYNELPDILHDRLLDVFAIPDTEQARLQMNAVTRWNAKSPTLEFEADSARKQREASLALRDAVSRFAARAYGALEAARATQRSTP